MKLTFKITSITIVVVLMAFMIRLFVKAESKIETNQSIILKENEDNINVENIINYNDKHIIIKNDTITFDKEIIKGNLIAHKINTNKLYLIVKDAKNYLYLIKDNKITKQIEIIMDSPKAISLCNNSIIIGGSNNNNMSIEKYDETLQLLDNINYIGNGMQMCNQLICIDGYIYVGGIKDAISENKYFKNVGSKNEIKTFIFKLDEDLNLIKDAYFNELMEKEILKDLYQYQDNIGVVIQGDKNYNYVLDKNLNMVSRANIKENVHIVQTNKKHGIGQLYLYQSPNYIKLEIQKNNIVETINMTEGTYINHYVNKGILYIYYLYNETIYLQELSEYHIDYLETLYLDYFDYDETTLNHFQVDSYLEDLTTKIDNISPYFVRNQNGKYEITYFLTRENNDEIIIKTPLIVRDYVNIRDGLVYPLGYQLFFFGNAKLNNKSINNGASLNTEGLQTLEITNANGEIKTYSFTVVDSYYKTINLPTMQTDFVMDKNATLWLSLGTKEVKSIAVNGINVGKIRKINNEYWAEINKENTPELIKVGYQKLVITEIQYSDNEIDKVNYSIILCVNKDNPNYVIQETNDKQKLNLKIDVNDEDQSLTNVIVDVYQNNKIIKSYVTNLKNIKITLPKLAINTPFELYVRAKSENENTTLMYYKGKLSKDITIPLTITFNENDNSIKTINIELDLSSTRLQHQQLLLGQNKQNLSSKYQVTKNNTITIFSIVGSLMIIIFVIIIMLKKKKQQN
ncbi:MAG: hypothetical protein MR485_01285 [Mollicutes bacterium]|nr:hypothetical protein [Mollicutes bacterium]